MRFATIKVNGTEKAGIVLKNGVLPIGRGCHESHPEAADSGTDKMV